MGPRNETFARDVVCFGLDEFAKDMFGSLGQFQAEPPGDQTTRDIGNIFKQGFLRRNSSKVNNFVIFQNSKHTIFKVPLFN